MKTEDNIVICRIPAFCDEVSKHPGEPVHVATIGHIKIVGFMQKASRFTPSELQRIKEQLPGRAFLEEI